MERRLESIKESLSGKFKFSNFLKITDFLTELITKETGYLRMVKIQEVDEMREIKQEACHLYATCIAYLKEHSNIMTPINQTNRQRRGL